MSGTESRKYPLPGSLSRSTGDWTRAGLERLLHEIRNTCLVCGKPREKHQIPAPERCCYCNTAYVAMCAMCSGPLCDRHGGEFEPPICRDIAVCLSFVTAERAER